MPKSIRSEGLLALGREIVKVRESHGMSQREFANMIGYRQSFLSKVELGLRRLDIVEFIVLARVMKVPASELLDVVEQATRPEQRI